MATSGYTKRIEQNVIDSDGTLIISHGRLAGGADKSRKMSLEHKRHLLHIDLAQIDTAQAARLINSWISRHHIEILNVTGTRTSEDPHIYKATMDILESAFYLSQVDNKKITLDPQNYTLPEKDPSSSDLVRLRTVDEAVEHLIDEMSLKDRTTMANLPKEELGPLNLNLGIYIRNQLFHTDENKELFNSCCNIAGNEHLSESGAAFVIIEQLWEKLRETHRLRIIK
jgi:hypothetical protein